MPLSSLLEIRVSQNLAKLEGEAHKKSGMEGGGNWSKLCSWGGRVTTLPIILKVRCNLSPFGWSKFQPSALPLKRIFCDLN